MDRTRTSCAREKCTSGLVVVWKLAVCLCRVEEKRDPYVYPSIQVRQIRTYLGIGRRCALLCGDVASAVLVMVVLVAAG